MSCNRVSGEFERNNCSRILGDFDRNGCNCNRGRDCDDDEVGGVTERERDCFTCRQGDFLCICVRCPRSWR